MSSTAECGQPTANGKTYRCMCRDRGYSECEQGYVLVNRVDTQVVAALDNITIPDDFKQRAKQRCRTG